MVDKVYARTLQKAAELSGGQKQLARMLRVPLAELEKWIAGEAAPPMSVFLKAIDFVLDETPSPFSRGSLLIAHLNFQRAARCHHLKSFPNLGTKKPSAVVCLPASQLRCEQFIGPPISVKRNFLLRAEAAFVSKTGLQLSIFNSSRKRFLFNLLCVLLSVV